MQIMLKARKNERKNKLFLTQSVIFKSQPLQIKLKFSDAFDSLGWINVWRIKHFFVLFVSVYFVWWIHRF